MDFAASNVRLSASGELMSGLGAPALTPIPMPERARSTRPTTFPALRRSSIAAAVRTATSACSPSRYRLLSVAALPHTIEILWPLPRSNCATNSGSAGFTPIVDSTLMSSARTVPAAATAAMMANPAAREVRALAFMAFLLRRLFCNCFFRSPVSGESAFGVRQDCRASPPCGIGHRGVADHERGHDGAINDEPERMRDLHRLLQPRFDAQRRQPFEHDFLVRDRQ